MVANPTLCVVFNNIDDRSSIGRLAKWAVETALDASWRVLVVARDVEPELRSSVTWRHLSVPPRVHLVQWAAAEMTVRAALRDCAWDVMHVYQPQLLALASTWHVEYLSRVAIDHGSLEAGPGLSVRLRRSQHRAVARLEDRYIQRHRDEPAILFCSALLRDEFIARYGIAASADVLPNPTLDSVGPPSALPPRMRHGTKAVLGYLGGIDPRKGYLELLDAVASLPDVALLMAGPGCRGFSDPRLQGRLEVLGQLADLAGFFEGIDILVVPSRFDPFAIVVLEAAARGIPVIVSPYVGATSHVIEHGAGVVWGPGMDLGAAIAQIAGDYPRFASGATRLARSLSADTLGRRLLDYWQRALPGPSANA